MDSFTLMVRVGLAPGTEQIAGIEDIRAIFKKAEALFLEICDIDLSFSIHEIKDWNIEEVDKKNDANFKDLRRRFYIQPTNAHIDQLVEIADCYVALYYILGTKDVDILVGFAPQLPGSFNGVAVKRLKACLCSLQTHSDFWPIILIHEILHILGLKDDCYDFQSIMYYDLPNLLSRKWDIREHLILDHNSKRIAKLRLKKLIELNSLRIQP